MISQAPPTPVPASSFQRIVGVLKLLALAGLVGWTAWKGLLSRPSQAAAIEAFARKDYSTAARLAQDDLELHPRSRESNRILGRSLSLMIYADEAEPYYQRVLESGPLKLEDLQDRVQGLILSNRRDRAAAACLAILEKFPEDPTTLRYLATVEFSRGRQAEAIAAAQRLSKTSDGKAVGLALLRDLYHEFGRIELAAKAGRDLVEVDPELKSLHYDLMTFWSELGDDLLASGMAEDARRLLRKVVEQTPNAQMLDLLATACFRLDERDEAERLWQRASAIDPRRINPLYRLGLIAMGRGQYTEAAELLEKAVANDTAKLEPAYNLARAYRALGRNGDAELLERRVEEFRKSAPPPAGGMGPSK